MKKFLLIVVLTYFVVLLVGFLGDVLFPPFWKIEDVWIFQGSRTMGLTLGNLSVLFAGIVLLISLTAISRRRGGTLTGTLLWRQIIVGLLLTTLLVGSLVGSIYILSKTVTIDNNGLAYYSLLERREVPWSEVKDFRGNFVAGSKLGLSKGEYGWFEFTTRNGEVSHFSLRFMQGVNRLESVIQQRLAEK